MSALHDALTEYLATRRALGTQLMWPESSLRGFVDFVESEGAEFVTTELAVRWALKSVGAQRATHARRLAIVRGFAGWLQATDTRTQVPPKGLLPARFRRPAPHIYTDGEIADLMAAATRLRSASGLRSATVKTLIGLLVATGLRPGEALRLDVGDVDLGSGVLTIRESKFGKSRFAPLEESTRSALAAYSTFRDTVLPRRETQAFFVAERGSRLASCAARRTFATLCKTVGLRPMGHPRRIGRGPRLQDMRHSFATRRLIAWYRARLDVDRLMPQLATYLGHASTVNTFSRALRQVSLWCREHRHEPIRQQQQGLAAKLRGHYAYYGVTGNAPALSRFAFEARRRWHYWLARRSNQGMVWERMNAILRLFPLPPPRVVHSVYRT